MVRARDSCRDLQNVRHDCCGHGADTTDPDKRASLLEMAEAWQELAEKEDRPLPLQTHTPVQQPAQQPQQPQPDDDKDE
jgi:hypothetical protein